MPYLTVPDKKGDIKIFYQVHGTGKPIVLIHGWLCDGSFWDDFLSLTEDGYQLIIPDLRGHGKSDVAKDVKIETLGEDINRLMSALGIEKAVIIGHSMGGLTAQAFYHAHPEKVIALGLWNTGARMPLGYGIGTLFYILRIVGYISMLILTYPITPLFKFVLAQGWKLSFKDKGNSKAYKNFVPNVKNMSKKAVLKAAFALSSINMIKKLPEIKVPTMLLHGTADKYISPIQMINTLKDNIPQNEPYFIENAAHFPPNEQPAIVLEKLKQFLKAINY